MNNIIRTFLLAFAILAQQQPPSVQDAIDRMRATLDQLQKDVQPPEPPKPVVLTTPEELDAAYATSADGDILTVDPALVYTRPFVAVKPITIQSAGLRIGRMDRSVPLPRFMHGITVAGENITLRGLEARLPDPRFTIVNITGAHVVLDRLRILGDPERGARRGITANSGGDVTILRSYVADCFQVHPGEDSQALIAWDMLPGLLIDDSYLEGGSETVLFGGGDSSDEAHQPQDIVIRNSTLTKNPAWKAQAKGVKNILELKAGKNVLVEGNTMSQSWGKAAGNGGGQNGYAIVLTVRNQDGRCPWCTIQDVTIRNNTISSAAAAITISGIDNVVETKTGVGRVPIGQLRPTVRTARVTISNNTFADIDAVAYYGGTSSKLILFSDGPNDVTIDKNTFENTGQTSTVYFANGRSENLNITSNTWGKTRYGVFSSAGAATWTTHVASGSLTGNIEQ